MLSVIESTKRKKAFSNYGSFSLVMTVLRTVMGTALLLSSAACSKTAELEGRVQDGQGRPLANVTLIATVQETKEQGGQPSVITDVNGAFRFPGLRPSTRYEIVPRSDQWMTEAKFTVTTVGAGGAETLKRPLLIRFTVIKDVVKDSKTGLEWRGQGKASSWSQAKELVDLLNAASGEYGWRLPTEQELVDIYSFRALNKHIRIDDSFHFTERFVWTAERVDYRQAPDAYFDILARQSSRASSSKASMGGMLDLAVGDPATYLENMAAKRMDMSAFVRIFDFSCGEDKWRSERFSSDSMGVLAVRTP